LSEADKDLTPSRFDETVNLVSLMELFQKLFYVHSKRSEEYQLPEV
jgi:hypothetical protein